MPVMESPARPDAPSDLAPLLVGDHLALDFLNTEHGEADLYREWLVSDRSVQEWLALVGLPDGDGAPPPDGLLALAVALRTSARAALAAQRSGAAEAADPSVINRVRAAGQHLSALQWDEAARAFRLVRPAPPATAEGLLAPVAEAIVQLLTETDPARVRRCEGDHCTLMFQDLTKSRRRRWCSMAACGNRMKVAAFRARQKSG